MRDVDISVLTAEEIAQLVLQYSAEEIGPIIPKMSQEQIEVAAAAMNPLKDPSWSFKLQKLFKELTEYPKLEALGRVLNFQQLQEIFDIAFETSPTDSWKLSPILVGLPHPVFFHFLSSATPKQLNFLKQEAITEPVQHHLTLITHQLAHQIPQEAALLTQFESEIEQLPTLELSRIDEIAIYDNLSQLRENYETILELINKTLSVAWNGNRGDLVSKLSEVKEGCQKLLDKVVGLPKSGEAQATGLYAKLEKHLQTVFGNPSDPMDISAAEDDEPALEALTKFSLWYLRDYWDVGLLPTIVDPEVIDRIAEHKLQPDQQDMRAILLSQVSENLNKLGLNTVRDLKKAGIYSKKLLEEYIAAHRYRLTTT